MKVKPEDIPESVLTAAGRSTYGDVELWREDREELATQIAVALNELFGSTPISIQDERFYSGVKCTVRPDRVCDAVLQAAVPEPDTLWCTCGTKTPQGEYHKRDCPAFDKTQPTWSRVEGLE